MARKSRRAVWTLVLLVAGFLIAFSYRYVKNGNVYAQVSQNPAQWQKEDQLRTEILKQQDLNQRLWQSIQQKRDKAIQIENQLAAQKKSTLHLVQELKKFRTVLGKEPVKGPGLVVTLSDSHYIPNGSNPNHYIVHEQYIRAVVYELLVSGAEAVAVNGQRITDYSYIKCVGPVVEVDGSKYPAPFVISAIGNPDTMYKSLFLPGNTVDQLVNKNIDVKVQKKQNLTIAPYFSEKGR